MTEVLAKFTQSICKALINPELDVDGDIGEKSNIAISMLKDKLFKIITSKGYSDIGNQIIGIRMSDIYTNEFTDWGCIILNGELIGFPISTKPGKYWLSQHGEDHKGCACLVEGQYRGLWQFNEVYNGWTGDPYCQQINQCTIYREMGEDFINRNSPKETGLFGINFHTWANFNIITVDNLSAGCQVMDESVEKEIIPYLEKFDNPPITYTLLHIFDFKY